MNGFWEPQVIIFQYALVTLAFCKNKIRKKASFKMGSVRLKYSSCDCKKSQIASVIKKRKKNTS
jgi:hypothetical protein